jgi:hypothetical protein
MIDQGESEERVMDKIEDFITDEIGQQHVDKGMDIVKQAIKNKDGEITFDVMLDQLRSNEEKAFAGEQVTFEDIKPYVSMYKGDDGKTVHDVLDKDENSVEKFDNAKDAMNYLSKNFSKLRGDAPKVSDFVKKESIKESRTKIVEAIKAKADGHAQDIAGVEGQVERIAQLANYQN